MTYLPMLGEYNYSAGVVKINIMSLIDKNIKIRVSPSTNISVKYNDMSLGCSNIPSVSDDEFGCIKLKKHRTTGIILSGISRGSKYCVRFSGIDDVIKIRTYEELHIRAYGCDCQLSYPTEIWDKIGTNKKKTYISYHLGDQLYLDLLYDAMYFTVKYEYFDKTKKEVYNYIYKNVYSEYFNFFIKKKEVLQNTFNIMIGDDHEITENTVRESGHVHEFLLKTLKNIFIQIQYSLKILDLDSDYTPYHTNKLSKNTIAYSLDNINLVSMELYSSQILQMLDNAEILNNIILFLPFPPLSQKSSFLGAGTEFDFTPVYDKIKELNGLGATVYIFCGDSHTCGKFTIYEDSTYICTIYNIGSISNVPGFDDKSTFSLNGKYSLCCNYVKWNNSYMSIKEVDDTIVTFHYNEINSSSLIFGSILWGMRKISNMTTFNPIMSFVFGRIGIEYKLIAMLNLLRIAVVKLFFLLF